MEDGHGVSGDLISDEFGDVWNSDRLGDKLITPPRYTFEDIGIPNMKIPSGKTNYDRILNTNEYDLLDHIQKKMSLQNKCILEYITDYEHRCPNWGDDVVKEKIIRFASQYVDDALKERYPRIERDGYTEDDEEWFSRLCHIVMQHRFPKHLQMIKCEQCLQKWMNSCEW